MEEKKRVFSHHSLFVQIVSPFFFIIEIIVINMFQII